MAGRGLFDSIEFILGTRRFGSMPGWHGDAWSYPLDTGFTLVNPSRYYEPRDEQGLPMHEYASVGRQYSPSRTMAWGLSHWNRLGAGDAAARDPVLDSASWLAEFQDGRFNYCFDWGESKSPWISCLAQGMGMSLLLRASTLSDNARFIDVANRALAPMLVDLKHDGVRGSIDGDLFLEEYPGKDHPHVLNGCLYAMVGLLDLVRHAPSADAEELLGTLGNTLERHIDRWDVGGWSAYDLSHESNGGHVNACTPGYQSLHATLLGFISRECGLVRCEEMAGRWLASRGNIIRRLRALKGKIQYRLRFPAQY